MKKTRGFLLAAGVALAMAFTFSCSSDDDGYSGTWLETCTEVYQLEKKCENEYLPEWEACDNLSNEDAVDACYSKVDRKAEKCFMDVGCPTNLDKCLEHYEDMGCDV